MTPDDVQAALDALGLETRVQIYESSTRTAQEAADSIGCELGAIAKSLCFMINGTPVVIITAGDQRVDTRKVAAHYDVGRKKVKIASPQQTHQATGFAVGGVSPVGHDLPILIDATLARFETVYAAAGSPNAIFPIAYEALLRVTEGMVVDVVQT
ncbi:MAG: YbaK/EbsC family protein [Chloroflexi bacterium]|nr:YbaK/EbsC family protein [Chloroflexota bacterium]